MFLIQEASLIVLLFRQQRKDKLIIDKLQMTLNSEFIRILRKDEHKESFSCNEDEEIEFSQQKR